MKALVGILGGFAVSMGMFAGGLVFATTMLSVEEEGKPGRSADVAELWTGAPRTVNRETQAFERAPGTNPVEEKPQVVAMATPDELSIGRPEPITGFGEDEEVVEEGSAWDAGADAALQAHLDWCANRYRSYDPTRNTYRSYSGGNRECVSPHLAEIRSAAADEVQPIQVADRGYTVIAAEETSNGLSAAHVRECQSRYRSYRVSDNTYQPYGGGPRRQCD